MTGLYKRTGSKNWWIQYYYRGRKFRESSGSRSRRVALVLLRKRLGEIGQGRPNCAALERVGVAELLADKQVNDRIHARASARVVDGHVAALLPVVGHLRAVDLTTPHLTRVIADWQAKGVAAATINKWIGTLRAALNLGRRATPPKVIQVPEFPHLAEHNAREGFFERADFLAVLGLLPDDGLRDFVEWAYWTGMRKGEIAKLEWAALDRETWTLTLPGRITKNRKPRRLALEGPLRAIIERRMVVRRLDCRLIFWRPYRGAPTAGLQPGMPVRVYEFRKTWATACRKAGLQAGKAGRIFHDLRRTGVRNLRRAGVDRKVAMAISGHRSESVFERYNIDTDDELREAVGKLASYVDTLPTTSTVIPMPAHRDGQGPTPTALQGPSRHPVR